MNHGVVMFQRRTMPESGIWELAMTRGQLIALYTARRMEERGSFDSDRELWSSSRVETTGDPLIFPPVPDIHGNFTAYARYEPSYDVPFLAMCQWCGGYSGALTVALPAESSDEEAMRLLGDFESRRYAVCQYLHDTFYVTPRHNRRNPKKPKISLPLQLGGIYLNHGWAYFLGFSRDCVVAFLSNDSSEVDGLIQPPDADRPVIRKADLLYYRGVIEKW
jgi:hypothetical protein